ncbi:MAG: hypothetical protein ABIR26_12445 [Ramlibacter sp.]
MAHDAGAALRVHEVDFHAVPGGWLTMREGVLHPNHIKNKVHSTVGEQLSLDPYDAVLVGAVGCIAARNQNTRHTLVNMALPKWEGDLPLVSAQVFPRAVRQALVDFPVIQLCSDIADVFKGQLFFQPWPLPSAAILNDREWRINQVYGQHAAEAVATYFQTQFEQLAKLMSGKGALLPYPEAEWFAAGFTPAEFGTADPWHMTPEYGALVLQQFADALDQT